MDWGDMKALRCILGNHKYLEFERYQAAIDSWATTDIHGIKIDYKRITLYILERCKYCKDTRAYRCYTTAGKSGHDGKLFDVEEIDYESARAKIEREKFVQQL